MITCALICLTLQKLCLVLEDLSLCHNEDNSLDMKHFAAKHRGASALGGVYERVLQEPADFCLSF